MALASSDRLKTRKQPRQARSKVTVEAIFQATIQVLLADGPLLLTTTRVAERAGVSIGTLYQYFPGKEALLHSLVARHLEHASQAVEEACFQNRHERLERRADAFVFAYIDAKTRDPDASRALYHASTAIEIKELSDALIRRLHAAARTLMADQSETLLEDLDDIIFSWVSIVTGGTRQIFEEDDTRNRLPRFREQLARMSRAYLAAATLNGSRT
jgi:AcrR family transcriptional regulator